MDPINGSNFGKLRIIDVVKLAHHMSCIKAWGTAIYMSRPS